jgi:two-component system phosphate regulon sensor histidine kinase PhoR
MKLSKSFIVISSIALLLLLAIQVKWLVETAKVKEELFNEKANMVLSRTAEALGGDKETCQKMGRCCVMDNLDDCKLQLEKTEVNKIDSLLKKFMAFYHFRLDYSFEVLQKRKGFGWNQKSLSSNKEFVQRLEEAAFKNGLELKLIFPEKKQFIYAEMGPMFIASVLLVLVVMFLFGLTIRTYLKEKELAQHLNDFLNNMTHEFKTPLTNIALSAKLMRKESNIHQQEKIFQYSDIILQENEKLRLQVEQVLGMTAFERGEIPLNKQSVDLHLLVQEAVNCMSLQIESAHGSYELNLHAHNFVVLGDRPHLSNAICNLLDNAIKYAKKQPFIRIETSNKEKHFILKISDTGLGISKEDQKKVFDKFFRVSTGNVHDVKGFGLGLAYVKKIAELHGGSIHLESQLGSGSTFTILLPLD